MYGVTYLFYNTVRSSFSDFQNETSGIIGYNRYKIGNTGMDSIITEFGFEDSFFDDLFDFI